MSREVLEGFPEAGARAPVAGTLSYSERAFESLAREALKGARGVLPARRRHGWGGGAGPREAEFRDRGERLYVHCSGHSERTVAFEVGMAVDGHEQITQVADRARRRLAQEVYRLTGKRCVVDIRVLDVRE